jgi:hypothetical protein
MSGGGCHSAASFVEKDPNEPEIAEHGSHRAILRGSYQNIPLKERSEVKKTSVEN